MKKNLFASVLGFSAVILVSMFVAVPAQGITIPGTSDPWLAGMPNGSSASFNPGGGEPADFAPAQSPVLVSGIVPGTLLMWTATGQVGHPGDIANPDGKPPLIIYSHYGGAENGISDITVPIDSLLGVFLGSGQPSNPAPGALDFSTPASRNYLSLAPALQQVFFMGDGLTDGAVAQTIVAPLGATRLYLGTMDGYSWNNNIGSFEITLSSVPEPTVLLLLVSSLLGLVGFRRAFRK
jgi:hypothetical protein